MSFSVYVHPIGRKGCVVPEPPVDRRDDDAWHHEYMKHLLVEVPLGGDGDVGEHWSGPAVELGLPLIASIYHHGLSVEGEQLDLLEAELDRLEEHWATTLGFDGETRSYGSFHRSDETRIPLLVLLDHRSDLLRVAIHVARVAPGYLEIS